MNQVFLAFQDSPEVLSKFRAFKNVLKFQFQKKSQKEYIEDRSNKVLNSLITLIKPMCDNLQISYTFMNDNLFLKSLNLGQEKPPFIIQLQNPKSVLQAAENTVNKMIDAKN